MQSDWYPGRITQEYRDNYDSVFNDGGKCEDQESNRGSEQVGKRTGMSEMSKDCG